MTAGWPASDAGGREEGARMWAGSVVSIHIAPEAEAEMMGLERVHAAAGRGLEGDRYAQGAGTYSDRPSSHEVTLIEAEALDALRESHQITLTPGISRRNIVTRGVPLSDLVDREFQIGAVRLRGVRLSEPCQHLVDVSGIPELLPGLVHRGGLHAVILASGEIALGDAVSPIAAD
jgi:MOSC domain-containing protein YiiM